jgi:mannitol operon transcriptional antiterminator
MALIQAGGQATTAELAEGLSLTPRMVRYRLDRLNSWLKKRDAVLKRQPGQGLQVDSTTEVRDRILSELCGLSGHELVLTPAQRHELLVFLLLLEDEPAIAKGLERRLGVSRTTLFKDLDEVGAWFRRRGLSLVRKPGFGIAVEGAERRRREALVNALFARLGSQALLFVCCGGHPKHISSFFPSFPIPYSGVIRFLSSLQIAHGRRAVAHVESLLGAQFSDDTFALLVLHLALLITRIAQGKTVKYPAEVVQSLTEHPCFSAALDVLGNLGRELSLPIPEDEAAYLTTKLVDAKVFRRLPDRVADVPNEIDVAVLVEQLVVSAARWLGDPRLADDEQIRHELTDHLQSLLQRLRFGLGVQSPQLDDVRALYPGVYQVAEQLTDLLAEAIGQSVPEEETGGLAMYLRAALERLRSAPRCRVLVICPMGAATSQLLASRLGAEFPQLEVVDVLSIREFLARPLTEADAVISTVRSLPVQIRLPMIHVSPLLPREDLARVQTWLAARLQEDLGVRQRISAGVQGVG